jgi:hypothetical protein
MTAAKAGQMGQSLQGPTVQILRLSLHRRQPPSSNDAGQLRVGHPGYLPRRQFGDGRLIQSFIGFL